MPPWDFVEWIKYEDTARASIVARAAAALKNGAIAVLPAEGVYGYHVVPSNDQAIARLALLKGRDPAQGGKGWIALVGRSEDAYRWVRAVPAPAAVLIRAHWPGALTLVFDAGPALPAVLRSADGTIALRCPGSAFLREVILAAGGLLVSTSANDPGAPPMTSATGPAAEAGRVGLVVDAGSLSGQVSTIARFDGDAVTVLRQGAVSLAGSPP